MLAWHSSGHQSSGAFGSYFFNEISTKQHFSMLCNKLGRSPQQDLGPVTVCVISAGVSR